MKTHTICKFSANERRRPLDVNMKIECDFIHRLTFSKEYFFPFSDQYGWLLI